MGLGAQKRLGAYKPKERALTGLGGWMHDGGLI